MPEYLGKWGEPQPGTGSGIVTWSFAQYYGAFADFSVPIAEGSFAQAIRRAFDTWESVANINFQEVPDYGPYEVDIRLGWSYIDGRLGTLGVTHYVVDYQGFHAVFPSFDTVEIEFDLQENWVYTQNVGNDGIDAYAVALHEIGHAIGLPHVWDPTSIMHPYVSVGSLSGRDAADMAYLYGDPFPTGFDALRYIASYDDLTRAFGANASLGTDHWLQAGRAEGRQITFVVLDYIASYGDLANAFGTDQTAGVTHYLNAGWREGRSVTFDGLTYIASYADLVLAFGVNAAAGTQHFIGAGRYEGRSATFDGLDYIASYVDLIQAFGPNADAGTMHWITNGYLEGRSTTFEALHYIASYPDLISAFGADASAGRAHWMTNGFLEGRSTTFDPAQYIASHDDLVFAFGFNESAGVQHWLQSGYREGRTADDFDELQYLANYADLQAAFGHDVDLATAHYIRYGRQEGRTDTALVMSTNAVSSLLAMESDFGYWHESLI